jgi:hypothetical protein
LSENLVNDSVVVESGQGLKSAPVQVSDADFRIFVYKLDETGLNPLTGNYWSNRIEYLKISVPFTSNDPISSSNPMLASVTSREVLSDPVANLIKFCGVKVIIYSKLDHLIIVVIFPLCSKML